MRRNLYRFSLDALYAALDEKRQAHGLSWTEVTDEINAPLQHTPSLPVSASTIRGLTKKKSVTSTVVLQALRWLGRTPEDFLTGRPREAAGNEEKLPAAAANEILRFDTRAMYEALDLERHGRGMSWKEIAGEMPGFTPGMLINLRGGPLIGFPRVMYLVQWLGVPASHFVRCRTR